MALARRLRDETAVTLNGSPRLCKWVSPMSGVGP